MKGSKNISAPARTTSAARSTCDQGSRRSRTADGFALTGVSDLPDPVTHAYRKDLADVALAGRVIASHYAEPLARHLVEDAVLLCEPSFDSAPITALSKGDEIRMLDNSLGWAWGYGPDGRVGYVPAEAIGG
ncbi:MAG: hypothetical protein LOX97_05190 [Sphingomonas sp.]|nr:hypothetical protein [Sphingomonas sp.]